jgi:hypothetical protein
LGPKSANGFESIRPNPMRHSAPVISSAPCQRCVVIRASVSLLSGGAAEINEAQRRAMSRAVPTPLPAGMVPPSMRGSLQSRGSSAASMPPDVSRYRDCHRRSSLGRSRNRAILPSCNRAISTRTKSRNCSRSSGSTSGTASAAISSAVGFRPRRIISPTTSMSASRYLRRNRKAPHR